MGRWLNWGRRLAPTNNRFWFGAAWTILGTALFALPWQFWVWIWQSKSSKHQNPKSNLAKCPISNLQSPISQSPIFSALALKPIFAYRNLRRAMSKVAEALARNDLVEARRLTAWHLVSRDTSDLSAAEVAGAAIESLAENLTDSVTAPLLAYAWGGLSAAWAYRFINTADAMWGYRNPEFEQLGKFPAQLDDILNWLPARLTAWLLVLAAGLVGAEAAQARQTMLAFHHTTPSPNAGWTMSAMAGALGVTLHKRGVYRLAGGEHSLDVATMRQAIQITDVAMGLFVGMVGLWLLRGFFLSRLYLKKLT
jgi:adenosylcobinamide-phosphate synthase